MFKTISPKLYKKYKDQVLNLSNALQRYEAKANLRGLSDKEIAEKLGLAEDEVTEIRILAELETPPLSNWQEAISHKREAAMKFISKHRRTTKE
jgi:DNA-directed RNA polymerase specialized sigma subunit